MGGLGVRAGGIQLRGIASYRWLCSMKARDPVPTLSFRLILRFIFSSPSHLHFSPLRFSCQHSCDYRAKVLLLLADSNRQNEYHSCLANKETAHRFGFSLVPSFLFLFSSVFAERAKVFADRFEGTECYRFRFTDEQIERTGIVILSIHFLLQTACSSSFTTCYPCDSVE